MKELHRRNLESKHSKITVENLLKAEISIMKLMDHPYLIKLKEALEDETSRKIYLVMDYCSKGALLSEDYWKAHHESENLVLDEQASKVLTYKRARKYFVQIAVGLNYRKPGSKLSSHRGEYHTPRYQTSEYSDR